jgi:hypothetical protein
MALFDDLPVTVTVDRAADKKDLIGVHLAIPPERINELPPPWRERVKNALYANAAWRD